jgi:hypothetical protein
LPETLKNARFHCKTADPDPISDHCLALNQKGYLRQIIHGTVINAAALFRVISPGRLVHARRVRFSAEERGGRPLISINAEDRNKFNCPARSAVREAAILSRTIKKWSITHDDAT